MSDDVGKAVRVHSLTLDHYMHEIIYARADQTVDVNNPLHDTDQAHCRALTEYSRNYYYDYEHSLMTVNFSFTVNLRRFDSCDYFTYDDGTMLLKEGGYLVMLHERHLGCSVKMLKNEDSVE